MATPRTAAITGSYIALAIALRTLVKFKLLAKNRCSRRSLPQVWASSVRSPADLCYEEDSRAEVDMNVVMTGSGKFVELQATAGKNAVFRRSNGCVTGPARRGIQDLLAAQQSAINSSTR